MYHLKKQLENMKITSVKRSSSSDLVYCVITPKLPTQDVVPHSLNQTPEQDSKAV